MKAHPTRQEFQGKLTPRGPGGAWTFMPIPFSVEKVFGSKARVLVAGTVNGFAFRNALLPEGDGTHSMMFGKEMQAGAKAKQGETVSVVLWLDDKPRTVEVPKELEAALKKNPKAAGFFAGLSPSCKKQYAEWIESAKQAETKERRVAKAVELLVAGKKQVR
jgi:hypothetical protein